MNWLETHLREFVLPMLKLYAKQKKDCNTSGREWNNLDKPLSLGKILHAKLYGNHPLTCFKCPDTLETVTSEIRPRTFDRKLPEEAKILATALKSYGLMPDVGWLANSILNPAPKSSVPTNWKLAGTRPLTLINLGYSVEDHAHWYLKTCVKTIRSRLKGTSKKVVLLGRDVWLVSVLCHKYGINHVFDPRISRRVANDEQMKSLLPEYMLKEGDILFDTGFAGSIHRAVTGHSMIHLDNLMMSANSKENQLFPNSGIARNYALFFEYLPKYFQSGRVENNQVVQDMADFSEFVEAAMGTIWAWHHESPAVMISDNPGPRNTLRPWFN
jgi:hypothetical protein